MKKVYIKRKELKGITKELNEVSDYLDRFGIMIDPALNDKELNEYIEAESRLIRVIRKLKEIKLQ